MKRIADLAVHRPKGAALGEITLEAGEFEGPWVLDKPCVLLGRGPETVLWARSGPVLTVTSPGARIENIALEVTEETDGVALTIADAAQKAPPALAGVHVFGRVEGLPNAARWDVPAVLDLGSLRPGSSVRRTIGLAAPGPVQTKAELAGTQVTIQPASLGHLTLQLSVEGIGFASGSLIEGRLVIESSGLISTVRLTGRIDKEGLPAREAATDAYSVLDRIVVPERSIPAAGDETRRSEPPVSHQQKAPSVGQLLSAASHATDTGNPDLAVELLRQATQLEPSNARAHQVLAEHLSAGGRLPEASLAWMRVLEIEPSNADTVARLARCYNQMQRFDQTVALVEQTLGRSALGSHDAGLLALATAYQQLGRFAEALWALRQARQTNPDPKLALLQRVWQQQLEHVKGP